MIAKGEQLTIEIPAGNDVEIHGFQMSLDCIDLSLVSVEGVTLDVTDDNFRFTDNGELRISWFHARGKTVQKGEILFRAIFHAVASGKLSDKIKMQSSTLKPEAYIGTDLRVDDLQIKFHESRKPADALSVRIEPNPFNNQATLKFNIPAGGETIIQFFDMSGRLVHVIHREYLPGAQSETINAKDLISGEGVIYCRVVNDGYTSTEKLVLLR